MERCPDGGQSKREKMAGRKREWPQSKHPVVNIYRDARRNIARTPGNGIRGYIAAGRRERWKKHGY